MIICIPVVDNPDSYTVNTTNTTLSFTVNICKDEVGSKIATPSCKKVRW